MQIYSDKIFKNPQKIISAFDSESFIFAFQEIEKLKNEYYLIGYVRSLAGREPESTDFQRRDMADREAGSGKEQKKRVATNRIKMDLQS